MSDAAASPPINGPDDYIGRHGPEKFFAFVDAACPASDDRPRFVTNNFDLAEGTAQALDALVEANDPPQLFLFGDAPVRIEKHPHDGRPLTRVLTESRMVHHLAEAVQFVKVRKDGQTRPTLPPVPIARNILASPTLRFPLLNRVVEVPVYGQDGTLCDTPGYHSNAGILFQPPVGVEATPVPPNPTDADVDAARQLICEELLGDFPFVGESELAHAVGLLVLPFVRDLIDGPTPLHLIEKPTAGTGGSLLADVLLRPALGRPLPTMTAGKNTDEMRKRITALLSEGPVAVLIDNVRQLDFGDLAAAITALIWKDRLLGATRIVQFPVRCAWVATANNPVLSLETGRRTVRIRLDAGIDRPWLPRCFRHSDLRGWTMSHRARLITAALTLVQAWVARNRPAGSHPQLGSFEAWSHVIGGILETARIQGFLANLTTFYEDAVDDEAKTWTALVAAWQREHGTSIVGVQEIWKLTQGVEGIDLGDKGERSQRTRLGKTLARMRDRIFDGYQITTAKTVSGAHRWRLRPVNNPKTPPDGNAEIF